MKGNAVDNTQSLISVIMPVYNREKTVRHSVESVLNQTYPHIELILINDGSKDSSLSVCRDIADHDGRVKVLDQANAGPAAARRTASATSPTDDIFA